MRFRLSGALLLLLALVGASSASGQVSTTGSMVIMMDDAQGLRLAGVTVSVAAPDTITSRTAITNAEGVATIEALAPSADYIVKASLVGFREHERTKILVRSGQVTTLRLQLSISTVTEQVVVSASTPVVDVTRAMTATDITLQLTEKLPTGRSYQSYLQLVPGVLPDGQVGGVGTGNPASRSGVNFKENSATADNIGGSTDNVYYFEAINVTDPITGTFGANLNTEIIQEQKVVTGGIPAEYVGASGLISTVITKSGSNRYSGSANYFFRNDAFVSENQHSPGATFSFRDNAFTIGGPLVKDRLWGFGSFRNTKDVRDVIASDTLVFLRQAETSAKQGFAKGTFAPDRSSLLTVTFLNDPQTRSADTDSTVANSRIRRREQGGNNFMLGYNRVMNSTLLDIGFSKHDAAISDFTIENTSRNTVAFQTGMVRTLADEQLGGFGQNFPETRPTIQLRGSVQHVWRQHTLKGGLEWARHEDHRDLQYTGPELAQYTSISSQFLANGGVSAGLISTGAGWTTRQFRTSTASDFSGLITTINSLPNRASFYNLYDTDRNGTITTTELNSALVFNSTAGNPNNQINYYRTLQTAAGAQDTRVQGVSFFGQDQFSTGRFTFNLGLRAEQWGHYATTGDKVFGFEWNFAPRLSAVYDLTGDGRQKASAYWGRYYDPVRMDMTNFAGTATGQQRDEQLFINNQWVTYRTRGGPTVIDGFFSPTTKTPYTDELQLQYEADLGWGMSLSSAYYHRATRDIFEDFDPGLYTEPSVYGGDINNPGALFLGWDYFGWTATNHPAANFFLGTLPGSERNYNGLELTFRKRYLSQWQMLASYSYLNAQGNAISDGNADFAGDVLWLDPRAPNMYGVVTGTINNLFKVGGSYSTTWGLELGGSYRWNSGTVVHQTQFASSRRLPVEVTTAYVYNGVSDFWVADGAIGAVQNPGWGQLDARVQYVRKMGNVTGEVFLDIFNVTDNQGAIRLQDLGAGSGTTRYLDEFQWLNPRNIFLGFRVRF